LVVVCKSLPTNSKSEVNFEVGHLGKEVVTLKFTYQNLCNLELLVMAREEQGASTPASATKEHIYYSKHMTCYGNTGQSLAQ
ncbi:hypothetical protein E2I00_010888, partial [Balaenoptera physalus]